MDKNTEMAKSIILNQYIQNKARVNDMIMTQKLFSMRNECNPKVADVFHNAIDELINDGFIYTSGLGIHLTERGYDLIWD